MATFLASPDDKERAKQMKAYTKEKVSGCVMPTGHFVPEEDPKGTITKLKNFFLSIS